ncbi:hypothetical protein D3C74_265780 [compost metagenome]
MLDRNDIRRQIIACLSEHRIGIRANAVHLVDEQERGNLQLLKRVPNHFRLRLNAFYRGENQHRAIQHAQRPLHFGQKIDMARRIDQIDLRALPGERRHGRAHRNAALTLHFQRIGKRRAVIHAAQHANPSAFVQNMLCRRCLSGVDMGENPHVQTSRFDTLHYPAHRSPKYHAKNASATTLPAAPFG